MQAVMYGTLDSSDCERLTRCITGNVPEERWNAISVYDGGRRRDFAPTHPDPPMKWDE